MNWKSTTNHLMRRTIGYQLVKPRELGVAPALKNADHRHLDAPIFILSSVRSGSTLLRSIMGGHSALYGPPELHLHDLQVELANDYVARSMAAIGYSKADLENMLWDCMLAREVERAGARHLINKTPNDVFMWRRIRACWPDARFIFLQRHPYAIVQSWHRARPHWTEDEAIDSGLKYMLKVEEAKANLEGIVVRYEDVTADPEGVCSGICEYLGLRWEPGMLDYGKSGGDDFRAGLGDWSTKIKSGRIQEAEPLPEASEVPPRLKEMCVTWGYL